MTSTIAPPREAAESGSRTAPPPVTACSTAAVSSDSLGALTLLVILVLGIPSVLVFEPLGAAGNPAGVLGDVLLVLAGVGLVAKPSLRRISTPISYLFVTFAIAVLAADFVGMLRPISGVETSSADRGLILLAAWAGITFTVSNGLRDRRRLDRFLITLVLGAGVLSIAGLLQFFVGLDIASYLHVPGLATNHPYGGLTVRSGFRRISGTALHSIEFGAVLSLILPISFHYALNEAPGKMRKLLYLALALTAFAIPMTVARSAILGFALVLLLLFPSWNSRQRRRALAIAPFGLVVLKLSAPHLIGTLTHLFTNASSDPSVQNRLGDYTAAGYYFTESPIFGRGFSTFLPQIYRTFDNQYEGMLVEGGLFGLLVLLALIIGSAGTALDVRMHSSDPVTRSLAYSLMTSMAVALVTFFTFDAFAFPMCMSVFFILLGAIGCLWRLERGGSLKPSAPRFGLRGWRVGLARAASAAVLCACVAGGLHYITATPNRYLSSATLQLSSKPFSGQNVFQKNLYLGDVPLLVYRAVTGPTTRAAMRNAGFSDYELAIGDGSLAHDTDSVGLGNVMRVASVDTDPARASRTTAAVVTEIKKTLSSWQTEAGARANAIVEVKSLAGPEVGPDPHSALRSKAMLALLTMTVSVAFYRFVLWLMGHNRRSKRGAPLAAQAAPPESVWSTTAADAPSS